MGDKRNKPDTDLMLALRHARGWLNMIAMERPETSDVHAVLAEVDAALALAAEARKQPYCAS